MKKTITLLAVAVGTAVTTHAQITIHPYDVVISGKVLYQAVDTLKSQMVAGLNPGPSGANKTWNFSNLLTGSLDTMYATNPAWLTYGTNFPTSNLAGLFTDGTEYYLKNDATGLYALGAYGDPTGQGAAVVAFSPSEQIISFPNTYNSSFSNTSTIDIKFPFTGFPTVDSVRLKEKKDKVIVTDAWGNVTTPMGTFPSLRLRGKVMTHDSIWMHSTLTSSWTFFTETLDSNWHFAWWASGVGLPVLEFDSTAGDTIRNITWLTTMPVIGGMHENAAFKGVNTYPNPSAGKFTLSMPTTVSEGAAEVYTLLGDKLFITPVIRGKDSSIDLSAQPSGIYFLKIRTNEGTITRKLVVNR